jgi:predicted DNA-binding protein
MMETNVEDYVDCRIALERLRGRDDEIISSEEMKNRLGIQD